MTIMNKVKKEYTAIRLPKELVEELQIWQEAFSRSYNRGRITYEFMLRGMLDSLSDTEPAVVAELEKMVKQDPSLLERMGRYCGR